ncbi:hypothetical protein [Yoonia sp. 2307UL14-13]|uniref:hypothetical protein n=1 Tax=Yoonia sp. 2307UL14-13 TaxID=3126506 RepID=UPI00309EBEC9
MDDFDLIRNVYRWLSNDVRNREMRSLPPDLSSEIRKRLPDVGIDLIVFENWADTSAMMTDADRINYKNIKKIYRVRLKNEVKF